MIPAIPIASPDIAPSTSPISIAFDVPTAWLAVPIATPFAILLSILLHLHIVGPIAAPTIPVETIATIVKAVSAFKALVISIPIAVVIDLGSIDINTSFSKFTSLDKKITDNIAEVDPTVIPKSIGTIFFSKFQFDYTMELLKLL